MCAKETPSLKRLTPEEWENAWQQHWKKPNRTTSCP